MKFKFNSSFSSEGGLPIPAGSTWEMIKDENRDAFGRPCKRTVTLKRTRGKKQRRLYYETLESLMELDVVTEAS